MSPNPSLPVVTIVPRNPAPVGVSAVVSPRDAASGLPSGKRTHGIIAILIGL